MTAIAHLLATVPTVGYGAATTRPASKRSDLLACSHIIDRIHHHHGKRDLTYLPTCTPA